jgi:hypothetical protein
LKLLSQRTPRGSWFESLELDVGLLESLPEGLDRGLERSLDLDERDLDLRRDLRRFLLDLERLLELRLDGIAVLSVILFETLGVCDRSNVC